MFTSKTKAYIRYKVSPMALILEQLHRKYIDDHFYNCKLKHRL